MKADKDKTIRTLKIARGQLDGIIKMIEEDRYCVDISNQLLATQAILKNTNKKILHSHLKSCVQGAFSETPEMVAVKIDEIIGIIDKISK